MPKIICVGHQKTGTSSVDVALRKLGFRVGNASALILRTQNWTSETLDEDIVQKTLEVLETVDAIQDSPCAYVYPALDIAYPGSKFILTIRDTDSWLKSYRNFFKDRNNGLRKWMYGVDRHTGFEDHYRQVFEQKNAEIKDYFKHRPDDFMVIDLAAGDGWLKLVNFLGDDFLKPFPHANRGKSG